MNLSEEQELLDWLKAGHISQEEYDDAIIELEIEEQRAGEEAELQMQIINGEY